MKRGLFLLAWLISHASGSLAQQLLCERQLDTGAPSLLKAVALVSWRPDSLRLISDYYPTGAYFPMQTRVQRLRLSNCDTLPTGPAVARLSRKNSILSITASNRRGQILIAQQLERPLAASSNRDSFRIVLSLFNRNGSARWRRVILPQSPAEEVTGVVEAPENGFFLCGGEYHPASLGAGTAYNIVLRLDSTGRVLWRRRYRQYPTSLLIATLANPTYTRTGTFVCTADYSSAPGTAQTVALVEFNQRGDSLTSRPVVVVPQQSARVPFYNVPNSLIPLRDGGFALVGQVDSASTGYMRPFLARLDRNLNLTWRYVYRPQATQYLRFAQPQELADGTLVVVASNLQSGRGYPFWLFRFAATGALQQRYPFVSQVLTANANGGRNGYFGIAQGLQPLSDSSFVVAAGASDLNSSRIYLARLRVPGLPRVVDSRYLPAADPLAARTGRAAGAALELFPNPASETVSVRYAVPPGVATVTLVLTDALGRAVYTQAVGAAAVTISVRALRSGLYQATVRAGGQVLAAQKLAVAR